MHIQECFKYLGYKKGDFPESEKAANEVLAIPIYPELSDQMKDYVAETIAAYFHTGS
jgi:dTDP-4-amino-4,6-dideoxygalactose transaminase